MQYWQLNFFPRQDHWNSVILSLILFFHTKRKITNFATSRTQRQSASINFPSKFARNPLLLLLLREQRGNKKATSLIPILIKWKLRSVFRIKSRTSCRNGCNKIIQGIQYSSPSAHIYIYIYWFFAAAKWRKENKKCRKKVSERREATYRCCHRPPLVKFAVNRIGKNARATWRTASVSRNNCKSAGYYRV